MENGRYRGKQGGFGSLAGIRKPFLAVLLLGLLAGCATIQRKSELRFLEHLKKQNLEIQLMECWDQKKALWDEFLEIKGRIKDLK